MPSDRPKKLPQAPGRRGILSEETVARAGAPQGQGENPYWADEEPDEHPDPSLGCIRRGLCCKRHPGWFAPGEAEQAAALLGMEPDAFVRRYLVVTSIEVEGEEVHCFAPVKLGVDGEPQLEPGTKADRLYYVLRGPCVFYGPEGCGIYAARPLECQRYVCTQEPEENLSKQELGRLWRDAARGEG